MITLLSGFPDNVLAARCEGRVTRQDYDTVLIPAITAALKQHPKLSLYYEVSPSFSGIDFAAAWEDFVVGMEHLARWERMAVVTDVEWMRVTMNMFRFVMPGRLRVFSVAEAAEARRWVAAETP